jgi:hypothetical protein
MTGRSAFTDGGFAMAMDLALIKPNLLVQAKGTGPVPGLQGITVGSVDAVDGPFVKLRNSNGNGKGGGAYHWIHLDCVDYADDKAIYLKLTENEFRSVRLDTQPLHDH